MKYILLFASLFFLVSCSSTIGSFNGNVLDIKQSVVEVDCSSAVNRNKKGVIDDIGYACFVMITEETVIKDKNGTQIGIDELKKEQKVQVVLGRKENISESKSSREVTAKEIIVFN